MNKFTINDWFTIQTRKDLTYIRKSLQHQTINYAIFADILIALLSFSLDHTIWDSSQPDTNAPAWYWIIISLLLCAVPAIILFIAHQRQKKAKLDSQKVMPLDELVNMFDNEICYNVMIADTMLEHMKSATDTSNEDEAEMAKFYFIETSYYVNKAAKQLLKFDVPADIAIGTEEGISVLRFKNVCEIVTDIYNSLKKESTDKQRFLDIVEQNNEIIDSYNALIDTLKLKKNLHLNNLSTALK